MSLEKVTRYEWLILAIALIIGLVSGFLIKGNLVGNVDKKDALAKPISTVYFTCAANKNILTQFWDGSVAIRLSDGRIYALPQAVSASGARYANTDESIVFWNKGDVAVVEENGLATYVDCNKAEEVLGDLN